MKPFARVAASALALVALAPPAYAGQNYLEPCAYRSSGVHSLCSGLIDYWGFEEDSDYIRFGAFGSPLQEVGGKNVSRIAEIRSGIEGSYSLDLEASDQSWLWTLGSLPSGDSAIAVTFKVESLTSSVGAPHVIASSDSVNVHGPLLYLLVTSTTGPVAQVCYVNYDLANTAHSVCTATGGVAVASTHIVVAGEEMDVDGKSKLYISLDGATKTYEAGSPTPTSWTRRGIGLTDVGAYRATYTSGGFSAYFDGQLDQFVLWGRSLSNAEIAALAGSGCPSACTGKPYPFTGE